MSTKLRKIHAEHNLSTFFVQLQLDKHRIYDFAYMYNTALRCIFPKNFCERIYLSALLVMWGW